MFTNDEIRSLRPHDFTGKKRKLYIGRRFTLDGAYIDEYVTYIWSDEDSESIVKTMKKIVEKL